MSLTPHRAPDSAEHNATMIGKAAKIVGQIVSSQDVFIAGEVEGRVEAVNHRVVIEPSGRVRGDVSANEVIVLGQMQGDVEAGGRVAIQKGARLAGDITTLRISIEDGALFKGRVETRKPLRGEICPGRQLVAYTSDESGRYEVYVAPFPGSGGQRQVSFSGGLLPRWSVDGKELFYAGLDAQLMTAEIAVDGREVSVGSVRPAADRNGPMTMPALGSRTAAD